MYGKIKKKTDKGYGFIVPDDGSKDVFFHAKDVPDHLFDELAEGDAVEFELEDSPKGVKAIGVIPASYE